MDHVDQANQVNQGILVEDAYTEYSLQSEAPRLESFEPARPISGLAAWIRLCRPPTLLLGLAPVLVTLAFLWAYSLHLSLLPILSMLISVSLVIAGASMLDEYLEFERTILRRQNQNNGGSYYEGNVLEGSGIQPLTALRVSIGLLGLGIVAGLPLIKSGGLPLLLLGAIGFAIAVLYSSTNYALKRMPAGELVILLALGPGLSAATALSQGHVPSLSVLALGLSLGLFTLALVLAAHLRDKEADRAISRRTVVQLNRHAGSVIYTLCLVAAYLLIALVALPTDASHGAFLAIFSLPATLVAWTGVGRALAHSSRHLAVRYTLRAYIYFAFWTFAGLLAGGLIVRLVALLQGHA
ncbi:MAG: prenyltransferase [Ktedonobacterales bacterium]